MKTNYFLSVVAIISLPLLLTRCAEAPNWDDEAYNSTPPGAVSNPIVTNINGGAVIHYTLPPEKDLLGVKALYSFRGGGEILETYSSAHTDSITLVGFPNTDERTVKLIAINSSKVESQPIEVAIRPLTIPVELIRNSLEVTETFSGVLVKWQNPTKADIGVSLFAEDSLGYMNLDYTYFTREAGHYAFRGYDDAERKFRIVIRDRWSNTTTPLDTILTPLPEENVVPYGADGRTTWVRYGYADRTTLWRGDYAGVYGSNDFWRMFDGVKTDAGYFHPGLAETYRLDLYTLRPEDATNNITRTQYLTIDMTRDTKLSRCKIYNRNGTTTLNPNDPQHLRVWASKETPKGAEDFDDDRIASLQYWTNWPAVHGVDGYKQDWTQIGEFIFIPPSGAMEMFTWTADDRIWYQAGVEFDFFSEHSNTAFRYLRIECVRNLTGNNTTQFHEWEIYGNVVRGGDDDDDTEE